MIAIDSTSSTNDAGQADAAELGDVAEHEPTPSSTMPVFSQNS